MSVRVAIRRLDHAQDLALPAYQTAGAAGLDLVAALAPQARLILEPGGRELVPTGFQIELPEGYEGQVRPRSSLALRNGVTVLNAPGTIDSDYRGEVGVILVNHGAEPFEILRGMRIAQLVIAPVVQASLYEAETLAASTRGGGGFGSTGSGLSESPTR